MHIQSIATTVAVMTACASMHAAPLFNPANGHWYDAISVPGGITWDDAKAAAEAMGGYLATSTSVAENDFIFLNFPEASADYFGYWLGGFQPGETAAPDDDPAAGWEWVTGEPFDPALWAVFGGPFNEPNDCDCLNHLEDVLHLWGTTGGWNDYVRDPMTAWGVFPIEGFVIEFDDSDGDGIFDGYDACPNSPPVGGNILIGGCDTGVPDALLSGGCTIADLIAELATAATNHGEFVNGVAHLKNTLRKQGLLSNRQAAALQMCASAAPIP